MINVAELRATIFLRKAKKDSIITAVTILIDTFICIASLFIVTATAVVTDILLISLVLAFFTGIVCVWRFNGFKKFFKVIDQNKLVKTTLNKLKGYNKLFDRSAVILSIFDILSTIIIILAVGWVVQDAWLGLLFRVGIMSVRVTNNTVQVVKLTRALRAIALVSGIYAISRGNRHIINKGGDFMKRFIQWLKNNPRTLAGIGTLLAAGVTAIIAFVTEGGLGIPDWISGTIISGLTALGAIFTGWAGFETNEAAEARKEHELEIQQEKLNVISETKKKKEYITLAKEQLIAKQDAEVLRLAAEMEATEKKSAIVQQAAPIVSVVVDAPVNQNVHTDNIP